MRQTKLTEFANCNQEKQTVCWERQEGLIKDCADCLKYGEACSGIGNKKTKFLDDTLEETLDFYFPKGDSRRGEALIIFAKARIEIDKIKEAGDFWQGKREGLEQGKEEERQRWVKEIERCPRTDFIPRAYFEFNVPFGVFIKLRDGK